MKASDLLVKCLENEGVEYIFGIPGEENLDFLESLRTSHIKLIVTRHEQAAAFMAATYGRLTGKPGVALSTLGPGATNLVTGVAYAQLGGMPLVVITGQKPIRKSKQGQFQVIDAVEMMRPITKMADRIESGDKVAPLVREAFRIAMEERPGAVHLELPEDIAREETDGSPIPIHTVRRPGPDKKAVEVAAEMIKSAKSPLILIGAGANRKEILHHLASFIEGTQIPFFNTQMGKGSAFSVYQYYIGTAALSDGDYLHCAIDRADLIINIGHDVVEKPPFFMHIGGKKVIHINFSSARVDTIYFPDLEVVGDISDTLKQLLEMVSPQPHWDFEYFFRVKERILAHVAEKSSDPSFPAIPQRFVADVRKAMPEDGIIALDNGIYKVWFARQYRVFQRNGILLDNALATMGAGLPSAMAAKMVFPDKKVMAICGDGGFMMNDQELETAIRLHLDLVVLILNDNAFGMIKWKQEGMGFDDFGLDLKNPDFVKFAESFGATGYRIEKTEDIVPTLKKALDSKGVHVIELPVSYTENTRVLTEELKHRNCLF
ncbi:MAG: acetolactate synthase large subunit [Candidatus Peregrinibacteria bacterium]